MIRHPEEYDAMPVGIVAASRPGVTRWQRTVWSVTGILPGAAPSEWRLLREDGARRAYHAATRPLELHGAETEAYLHNLTSRAPSLYVVLRPAATGDDPPRVVLVTASPYEAQDYTDSGEEIVEKVAIPAEVAAWIEGFCARHHHEETFRKRRRDRARTDLVEDGIGDARIAQAADVYRSPRSRRERLQ